MYANPVNDCLNHIITFCLHFSDGSALNHYHHNTNYNRGSTDAIATVEDSDFDDFSDSGGGSLLDGGHLL